MECRPIGKRIREQEVARANWTHIRVRTGDDVELETRTSRGTTDSLTLNQFHPQCSCGTSREFRFKKQFLFIEKGVIREDELGG